MVIEFIPFHLTIAAFSFLKRMTGALAPFSYLVINVGLSLVTGSSSSADIRTLIYKPLGQGFVSSRCFSSAENVGKSGVIILVTILSLLLG